MAHVIENRNSDGKLMSYSIRVFRGRDITGKQLKSYFTTFEVPEKWTDEKALKEANKQAVLFEKQCKDGLVGIEKQTFAEYAAYVMQLKEKNQKHRTVERYGDLLKRIIPAIGHMKLTDIRPQHLNQFYTNLGEVGVRDDVKYKCKIDLKQLLKEKGSTKVRFGEENGISMGVLNGITQGKNVRLASAQAVSKALNRPFKDVFSPSTEITSLSNKTILEYHRLISTIMSQAEKEMLIIYNPAHRATPPKLTRTQANYFQIDVVNRIIDCLENEPIKWKTITYLLMLTGCRRGEILGLKWDKIDFETGTIKIENTLLRSQTKGIYEDTTKSGKNRPIQLPPEAMQLLKDYRLWYMKEKLKNGDRWQTDPKWKGSNFVFVQEDKNPGNPIYPDSISDWLGNFSKRHDLPHVNPHAFRHTFASILISKGVDIVTVSKALGHEKVSTTTDIYAELMKQASEQASECIADTILRRTK